MVVVSWRPFPMINFGVLVSALTLMVLVVELALALLLLNTQLNRSKSFKIITMI
tara:strand:- start:342 stop:503 length:162 start_codon:yes stop_codon:yes gene_type:complete